MISKDNHKNVTFGKKVEFCGQFFLMPVIILVIFGHGTEHNPTYSTAR
jgi:hypothetical protein